jgi:hypothetical protein
LFPSLTLLALAHHPACSDGQNQQAFAGCLSQPYRERYLEWRQAEDAQQQECVTVVGKLEEGIKHSGLVVCEFHQAPLDCYDDPCEVRHPKSLLKKQNCMYIVE